LDGLALSIVVRIIVIIIYRCISSQSSNRFDFFNFYLSYTYKIDTWTIIDLFCTSRTRPFKNWWAFYFIVYIIYAFAAPYNIEVSTYYNVQTAVALLIRYSKLVCKAFYTLRPLLTVFTNYTQRVGSTWASIDGK